jgi:PAS domain S-box-containing protein
LPATLPARRHAEDELRRSHAETARLLNSISSVLIGIDENGRVTRWNESAARTFGIPHEQVVGKPFVNCGIAWVDPRLQR